MLNFELIKQDDKSISGKGERKSVLVKRRERHVLQN